MALGEALAVGVDDERHVEVAGTAAGRAAPGGRSAAASILSRLSPRTTLGHALRPVVDDDGEVVRRHTVVAAQHDVVGDTGHRAGEHVVERDPGADRRHRSGNAGGRPSPLAARRARARREPDGRFPHRRRARPHCGALGADSISSRISRRVQKHS